MDFDNPKVYGDTFITDGLVFFIVGEDCWINCLVLAVNYDTAGENGKEERSARNYISPSSAHRRDQVAFVISSNIKKHIISFNVFEVDI